MSVPDVDVDMLAPTARPLARRAPHASAARAARADSSHRSISAAKGRIAKLEDARDRERMHAVQNWCWTLVSTKQIPAVDVTTLQACPSEMIAALEHARVVYGKPPLSPAQRRSFRRAMLPYLESPDDTQVALVEQLLVYWGCL